MIKPMIMTGVIALLWIAGAVAPVGISAQAAGSHMSTRSSGHAPPVLHHRRNSRFFWGSGYYPYGSHGDGGDVAPPPSEKPVAETRRECEPKFYSVPSASGGESQVTIIRC